MILLHGRGAAPESMLPLAQAFGRDDILYLLPRAAGNTWYPNSFLAPIEANEPWLSSALSVVGALVSRLRRRRLCRGTDRHCGIFAGRLPDLRIRRPQREALRLARGADRRRHRIRPTPRNYSGLLDGTPVFLGCSDIDFHVPLERVHETRDVFTALGAKVDMRIYPRMGHTVNDDEVQAVTAMLGTIAAE